MPGCEGFTLLETVTAMCILALMCTGIVVVMSRCTTTANNLTLQIQAFDVAQQQMEEVLAKSSVRESVDMGTSEQYPNVEWQTTIEVFEEPVGSALWARAICSSQYEDVDGQPQTVELACWLGRLTEDQLAKLERERNADANDPLVDGVEAAAEYAGVTPETIRAWIAKGLLVSEDGTFVKANLDIFKRADGRPSEADKQRQVQPAESSADESGAAETASSRPQDSGTQRSDTPPGRLPGAGRSGDRSQP